LVYRKFANKKGNNIDIKKIVLIFLAGIFLIRFGYVALSTKKDNSKAYISLLNKGLPYAEAVNSTDTTNNLSIKDMLIETVGLSKLSLFSLIKSEVPYFNNISTQTISHEDNSIATLNPFELDNNSLIKYTPEEAPDPNAVASKAYEPSLKQTLDINKPRVLIYHSHTMEYYNPATKETANENDSVVGVGNALAKELEQNYGIATLHDKTNHSVSYDDSYKRSGETLQKYLNQYKNFDIIIDLHRDAVSGKVLTANINGEELAPIMFVTAKNNPHYAENQALTDKLNGLSRNLFPGLSRGITTYTRGKDSFNQSKNPNVILIEVGFNTNTNTQAQASAKYIARLIAEALKKS